MKINEFIVVEGKDDTERVKSAVDCDTIETNGSAIDTYTFPTLRPINGSETQLSPVFSRFVLLGHSCPSRIRFMM